MAGGEKQKQLAALAPSSGASRHLLPLRRRRVGVLGFPGRRHNGDSRLTPAPTSNSPATVSFRTSRTPTTKPTPPPPPAPSSAGSRWLLSTTCGPPWPCCLCPPYVVPWANTSGHTPTQIVIAMSQ